MRQYIYGKSTVIESFKGSKPVYEIYMLKNMKDEKIITLAKAKNARVNFVAHKGVLNDMVGNVVHQGVVAQVEGYGYSSIKEILKAIPNG